MLHYYIAYALMLFVAILCIGKNNKNMIYCIVFALIWIALLGLRHPQMGVDLQYGEDNGYFGQYIQIGELSWSFLAKNDILNYEKGYVYLCKLLNYISRDPQFFLFACSVISIGIVADWMYKNSEFPFISSVIYLGLQCFLINFSGIRQALAIAITLLAFEMITRKKLLWFVLLVWLASTFHSSAIVFLVAYPVYHMRLSKIGSMATLAIPIIVYIIRYPLFRTLSKILKDNARVDDNGAIVMFLIFWMIYVFAVLFGHERDKEELGVRNLFLVASAVQAFGNIYNNAMRVGYYFMIYLALLLPKLIKNTVKTEVDFTERGSSMIMYLVIAICFIAFAINTLSTGIWSTTNPHLFFWQTGG